MADNYITSSSVAGKSACTHTSFKISCADCNLKGLCLPMALDLTEIDQLEKIIQRGRPLQTGDHLFRSGEDYSSIYAIHSGSVKTYMILGDGTEQVTGFYLPGEVLGFENIGNKVYGNYAIALDTSTVCEIPFDKIEEIVLKIPHLQHHIFQLMSNQIGDINQRMFTITKKYSIGRLATLLLSFSKRNSQRNLSSRAMRLSMSRLDIGNFLGLTIESVSRAFSQLHKEGILIVDGREIIIKDSVRLEALCHNQL